jgi:DNA-binding NarL/FixJ family response regulator
LQKEVPEVLFIDVTMPEEDISRILDAISRDKRYEQTRTVIVTRSDAGADHSDWLRRATAAVVYNEREEPADLLQELRAVLVSIGAPVPA